MYKMERKLQETISEYDGMIKKLILEFECWKMLVAFFNGDNMCFSNQIHSNVMNRVFQNLAHPKKLTISELLTLIMYQIETDTFNENIPLLLNLLSQSYDIDISDDTNYPDFSRLRNAIGNILLDLPMPNILNMLSELKDKPPLYASADKYYGQVKLSEEIKSNLREEMAEDKVANSIITNVFPLKVKPIIQTIEETQKEGQRSPLVPNVVNLAGTPEPQTSNCLVSDFGISSKRPNKVMINSKNISELNSTNRSESSSDSSLTVSSLGELAEQCKTSLKPSMRNKNVLLTDTSCSSYKLQHEIIPSTSPSLHSSGNQENHNAEAGELSETESCVNGSGTAEDEIPTKSQPSRIQPVRRRKKQLLPLVSIPKDITPDTSLLNTSKLRRNHINNYERKFRNTSTAPASNKRKESSDTSSNDWGNKFLRADKSRVKRRPSPRRRGFARADDIKTKRIMWTLEEEEVLVMGVAKHGVGNWKEIINKGALPSRSVRDCYDKWKNINKYSHLENIKARIKRRYNLNL